MLRLLGAGGWSRAAVAEICALLVLVAFRVHRVREVSAARRVRDVLVAHPTAMSVVWAACLPCVAAPVRAPRWQDGVCPS